MITRIKSDKNRRLFIIWGSVLFIIFLWWVTSGGFLIGHKFAMEKYLKDRYGIDSYVFNVRVNGGGIGQEGDVTGQALIFGKNIIIEVSEIYSDVYDDGYIHNMWAEEIKSQFTPDISRIFCKSSNVKAEVFIDRDIVRRMSKNTGILTFKQVSDKYKDKLYVSFYITECADSDIDAIAEKIYNLLNELHNSNIRASIGYKMPGAGGNIGIGVKEADTVKTKADVRANLMMKGKKNISQLSRIKLQSTDHRMFRIS